MTPQQEAASQLAALISKATPNSYGKPTFYTVLRKVSASGMTRHISPVLVINGEPRDVSHLVALACGLRRADGWEYNAVKVSGAGMDMGFHLMHTACAACGVDYQQVAHRWL